jgi:hypothetical protein
MPVKDYFPMKLITDNNIYYIFMILKEKKMNDFLRFVYVNKYNNCFV